jgi:hypothetical protein
VDKTTAQQPKVHQFETDRRQELGLRKFSVKIPRPYNSLGSSKIRIAQQAKVQQFESTGFQDPQAATAETSGNYYDSYGGKSDLQVATREKKVGKLEGKGREKKLF